MPQDAFTLKHVSRELDALISGGKITKITQPDKETLTLYIYTKKTTVKLEICLSARMCRINVTCDELPAQKTAPAFCMLLRKHLQNAEIKKVAAIESERIVYLDLLCAHEFETENLRFYLEIMGKYSNAVLCKDEIILGALKTSSVGDDARRLLFSGVKYALPAPQDKISQSDFDGLKKLFSTDFNGDAAKFISDNVRGVCYSTALDMVKKFGERLTGEQAYNYLNLTAPAPCVTYVKNEPHDFNVFSSSENAKLYDNVLAAQSAYYSFVVHRDRLEDRRRRILASVSAAIKKAEKRLAAAEEKILDCKEVNKFELYGELITANIYKISRGDDKLVAENYYDGTIVDIPLDKAISPSENAQRYYKKYTKLKRSLQINTEQKTEAKARINYLKSIETNVVTAIRLEDFDETEDELKSLGILKPEKDIKKRPVPPALRTYILDGFTVLSGRNNIQNDRLLKMLSPTDIWLHAKGFHSSHVGIILEGRQPSDEVILSAASICASFSEAKSNEKVQIDYTLRKFVKKPTGAASGFVTYTNQKTVIVSPQFNFEEVKK